MTFYVAVAYLGSVLACAMSVAVLLGNDRRMVRSAFAVGMLIFAAEAVFSGLAQSMPGPAELIRWQEWRLVALSFLSAPWIYFSMTFARGSERKRHFAKTIVLWLLCLVPPVITLTALWESVAAESDAATAWGAVLTVLLRDPAYVSD